MKIMIQLNGELYSPLSYSVNRQLPEIGELRPNRASVSLDNTQNDFKFNPSTNKIIDKNNNVVDKDIKIIIYDYETSKIFFTGYTDIPEINFKNKTLEINAHDSITYLQEQIAEEKLYLDSQLDNIILNILDGYDIASEFADISLVIDNYRIEKDTTKADALKTLLTDVGGLLYTNEKNEIVFDGGYIKALQNPPKTPIDNLYKTHVKSYDTTLPDNSYDKIIITSESLKKKDKLKYIYINADYEKPESDITKVNFDNPIWYLDDYSNIEFKSDDGVIFDETTYNSNFLSGNTPKNADSITVDYGFNTGKIDYLKIKGKEFETNTFEGVAGADLLTNKTKTIKCSLIQSSTWASDLANYYYRELHNRPQSRVILADFERFFDLEYNLNKYVNIFFVDEGISNKMQITAYKIAVSSRKFDIELTLKYSSGDSFVPSPLTITESNNNQGLDLDEIANDLSDIASDNKLTPNEKITVKKEWERIQNEYSTTLTTANNYGLSTTNYTNAYNALNSYITPLLSNLTTTSDITRTTFNNKFNNYYSQLKNILDNTDIKVNQDMTNKKLYQGTTFELGKGALPDGSDGLYIDAGQLLIGQSKTADKRLYYDGTNLEIVGGTLKLSSDNGEIEFLDSGLSIVSSGETAQSYSGIRIYNTSRELNDARGAFNFSTVEDSVENSCFTSFSLQQYIDITRFSKFQIALGSDGSEDPTSFLRNYLEMRFSGFESNDIGFIQFNGSRHHIRFFMQDPNYETDFLMRQACFAFPAGERTTDPTISEIGSTGLGWMYHNGSRFRVGISDRLGNRWRTISTNSYTTLQSSAPSNPEFGDIYEDSDNNNVYIYTSNGWKIITTL